MIMKEERKEGRGEGTGRTKMEKLRKTGMSEDGEEMRTMNMKQGRKKRRGTEKE